VRDKLPDYLKHFPKPLLDDIFHGRSLPFIGAGLSRNATVPGGGVVPLFGELGKILADAIPNFDYINPTDALSAYSQAFSRVRLVEEVSRLLHSNSAQPGRVHLSFARLPFDTVATTNFDFLIEQSYSVAARKFRTIMTEDQLSIGAENLRIDLLKIHGDLNNPARLIMTEEDYDSFLIRFPLFATYIANILIRRVAIFIGYSLDDPDLRQIIQLLRERLGRMHRESYAIAVGANPDVVARFARRGVTVINLPGSLHRYGDILADTFDQLNAAWLQEASTHPLLRREDESSAQLEIPKESATTLCYFAVPHSKEGAYRSSLSPIAEAAGFAPIYGSDLGGGSNYMARLTGALQKMEILVADTASPHVRYELDLFYELNRKRRSVLLLASDVTATEERGVETIALPSDGNLDDPAFQRRVHAWFRDKADALLQTYRDEPDRLFRSGEYQAAVISAFTLLETGLREAISEKAQRATNPESLTIELTSRWSIRALLDEAVRLELTQGLTREEVSELVRLRNSVIHGRERVGRAQAMRTLRTVQSILRALV
jgi:hypothetical protein